MRKQFASAVAANRYQRNPEVGQRRKSLIPQCQSQQIYQARTFAERIQPQPCSLKIAANPVELLPVKAAQSGARTGDQPEDFQRLADPAVAAGCS